MRLQFWKPRQPTGDETTFPELVFAHFLRQRELYAAAQSGAPTEDAALHGPAEEEYRRRLKAFTARYGEIVDAYWATHEISGVALTERQAWTWHALLPRRELVTRLHLATDWATRETPAVAAQLHRCRALAVRANEVLLGTSERIVTRLVVCAAARLLALVDTEKGEPAPTRDAVFSAKRELDEIEDYYEQAGEKAVRVVYSRGMLLGLFVVATPIGFIWWLGPDIVREQPGRNLVVSICMGSLGALVSVMTRMADRDGRFRLDPELGRREARRLGMFRPFLGAAFALVLFLGLRSGLVDVFGNVTKRTTEFYAFVAFLSGFSERWVKVVLDGATQPEPPAKPSPGRERAPARAPIEEPPETAAVTVPTT